MSNDSAGRTPRTTGGTGPMGSTVAIVVTVVALVLGFLILRNVNDDGDSADDGTSQTTPSSSSTPDASSTTAGSTTTTTTPLVTEGTNVLVANCSTQNGVAGQMSTALESVGFTMAEPTNGTVKLATSKVLYNADDPNAKPVADSLAQLLGGLTVEPTGVPIPAGDGNWPAGTAVLLMLGDDLAGKTLDQIAGQPTTGTTGPSTTAATSTT